ncbi:SAM-dependent methyltransferase [Mycolicibacterium sp. F2034L]|uniref:SAM-dependent methyltransferase n=1 Tax=Mycolicibacterium sp. F2034L TaxID=2926422 RepID=UPI001FF61DE8|nr:SAM-dependent methyltransferase [Mycolicibacterium sp. F2034L]MCK0175799.1 nodulation S family protein [Mycolicibacterium sp. F2034L]
MTGRLPDGYFERVYADAADPWSLQSRWYEQRKYALTTAMLPHPRYRHAFEPGCSVGVLTELLLQRCDRVTATDVAVPALDATRRRLVRAGVGERAHLLRRSLDEPWPADEFDLVVLSEVCYYLTPATLRAVVDREVPRLVTLGATVLVAHWRHPVADYPMTGDDVRDLFASTAGLHHLGGYRDADVVIDVFDTASAESVASRTAVPGA